MEKVDPNILVGEQLAAEAAYQAAIVRHREEGTDESRDMMIEAEERLIALKKLIEIASVGRVSN